MEQDDPYEKTLPKINQFILEIFILYSTLTLICCYYILLLWNEWI